MPDKADKRRDPGTDLSEDTVLRLIEAAPYAFSVLDETGTVRFESPSVRRLTGSAEGWVGRSPFELVHPDDLARARSLFARLVAEPGGVTEARVRYLHGGGSWRQVECVAQNALHDPAVRGIFVNWRDVTDEQRAAAILAAVAASAEFLLQADDWQQVVGRVLESLGRAADVSRAYVFENHRGEDGGLLTSQCFEWCAEGIASETANPANQAIPFDGGTFVPGLAQGLVVQGHARDLGPAWRAFLAAQGVRSILLVPVNVGGKWWGLIGFDECAAEREWSEPEVEALRAAAGTLGAAIQRARAELELDEARERYRSLVEHLPLTTYIDSLDAQMSSIYVSPQIEALLGHPPEDFTLDPTLFARLVHPDDRERVVDPAWPDTDGPHRVEYRFATEDGRTVHVLDAYRIVRGGDGRRLYAQGYLLDITERREAEDALRRSEEQFHAVFESSLDGMVLLDDEGRYVDANPAACELYGVTRAELVSRSVGDFSDDHTVARRGFGELLAAGGLAGEGEIVRPDGTRRHVEFRARTGVLPGLHLSLVRDATERKALQTQLLQSQRLEAVGRLAGGIAHDFNNLLTAIGGYGEFLLEDLAEDDPRRRDAVEITTAAGRAAALVSQLLAFSRRQILHPQVVDLNRIVAGIEPMLRRLIGEDVELVTRLDPDLPPISADPGQIEQMIVNLAVNARDAMPAGGRLSIETEGRPVEAGGPPEALLAVGDSGVGMSEETRSHAFDPFFTTKAAGQGTGLGLATVYGIVAQSGGRIEVESEEGSGTVFRASFTAAEHGPEAPGEPERAAAPVGGSETILVAEDEAMVRELARRALAQAGYVVLQAGDAAEALRVAAGHPGPIDLLLTDVVMPGTSGRHLADSLRERRPDLRVVYMSGYTDDDVLRRGVPEREAFFLPKPFTPGSLARRVREVLDR